ncbi:MAG: hypothetical protein R3E91_05425 [Chlamydiales bacterium]
MSPATWDYFRSFFYSNTTVSPIDLEGNLTAGKYKCCYEDVIKTAQRITSSEDVQKVLSQPFGNYVQKIQENQEIEERIKVLKEHGFKFPYSTNVIIDDESFSRAGIKTVPDYSVREHGEPVPYYSVCEHEGLDGWIIKSGVPRIPEDLINAMYLFPQYDHNEFAISTQHDSLLRFEMRDRLRQAAQRRGIDLVMPEEYAIPYLTIDSTGTDVTKQYFVLSKKLDVLSSEETVKALKNEELQKCYASNVIALIEETGYTDISIDNIRLTQKNEITILDTKPVGLLTKRGNELYPKGSSLEKHVRIGLFNLKEFAELAALNIVAEQAEQHYYAALKSVSITKIALTALSCLIPLALLISTIVYPNLLNQVLTQHQILAVQMTLGSLTPLVPIVLLIISAVKCRSIYNEAKELKEKDSGFFTKNRALKNSNSLEFKHRFVEHQKDIISLSRRFFRRIEGIPFQSFYHRP